jgi:hypothetical protein
VVLVQLVQPARPEAPSPGELLSLARNTSPDARQRLLLGVLALCDASPPSGELSPVLGEIFLTLARQAEREVRKALSEKLAHADWAPAALVNVLALDEIEIARPLLASSPILQDDDLLRVMVEASLEHQIAIARRPQISGRVADAVIDRGEPAVLTALATNRTADLSLDGVRRLVEHSRRIAALRAPLTRHPRLTEALAEQMYHWVGTALRQSITARFNVDDKALGAAVYDAVEGVLRQTNAEEIRPERSCPRRDGTATDRQTAVRRTTSGWLPDPRCPREAPEPVCPWSGRPGRFRGRRHPPFPDAPPPPKRSITPAPRSASTALSSPRC